MAWIEIIQKAVLAALGTPAVTREAIEEVTLRWLEEGKLSKEQAELLTRQLLQSGEQHWEELRSGLAATLQKAIANLDVCSRTEFQQLSERVAIIEQQLAIQQTALESTIKQE